MTFDYSKNRQGLPERSFAQASVPVILSFLLCLILVCFIFAFTGNFAYADSVTGSGDQGAAASVENTVYLQVLHNTVNVRSGPTTNDQIIGQVHLGEIVQAKIKSDDNWYQIDFHGGTGWIAGWLVQPSQPATDASRGLMSGIVSIAERFLGSPYHYGASGPYSFDCSGFTRYVFALIGIDLPRVADDQARIGEQVASPAPGDLVFFSAGRNGYMTHVGIYIGNNSFINAADQGVTITSLDDPWYQARYAMARRII